MRKQLMISVGAILAILAMTAPALAQGFCGAPFGGFGAGPVGCGFGAPLGGFGLPFGIGGCGFGDPFSGIIGLGLSMIEGVLGATFGMIGSLALGGLGFGGCGIPFGGFC